MSLITRWSDILCVLEVVIEDPVCSRHLSLVIVISSIPLSSSSPLLNGACSIFFLFLHFCLFLSQSKQGRRQWQWDSELTATTYHQRRRSASCLWSLFLYSVIAANCTFPPLVKLATTKARFSLFWEASVSSGRQDLHTAVRLFWSLVFSFGLVICGTDSWHFCLVLLRHTLVRWRWWVLWWSQLPALSPGPLFSSFTYF